MIPKPFDFVKTNSFEKDPANTISSAKVDQNIMKSLRGMSAFVP